MTTSFSSPGPANNVAAVSVLPIANDADAPHGKHKPMTTSAAAASVDPCLATFVSPRSQGSLLVATPGSSVRVRDLPGEWRRLSTGGHHVEAVPAQPRDGRGDHRT